MVNGKVDARDQASRYDVSKIRPASSLRRLGFQVTLVARPDQLKVRANAWPRQSDSRVGETRGTYVSSGCWKPLKGLFVLFGSDLLHKNELIPSRERLGYRKPT